MRHAGLAVALLLACGRTAPLIPAEQRCGPTRSCDDGLSCTTDVCLSDGNCRHVPHDEQCATADFCRVAPRCDVQLGCTWSARDCGGGASCNAPQCDETLRACVPRLDDSRCPAKQHCTEGGCVECVTAAHCDDGALCTVDTCSAQHRCVHTPSAALCDDGAACTVDVCDERGVCQHAPSDAACDDRIGCTVDRCLNAQCTHAADAAKCDDGVFCNGPEVCSVTTGCGPPVEAPFCDDGVTCTRDRCDEAAKQCTSTPDDASCGPGLLCGTAGCGVFAYATTSRGLYDVQLPSGSAKLIGQTVLGADAGTLLSLTDIALDPDGTLFGTSGGLLVTVNRLTGRLTPRLSLMQSLNALDVLPGGELYGSGGATVISINRVTGAKQQVATLPGNMVASGDLAVVDGHILITAVGPGQGTDRLVEVITDGGASRVIGDTGVNCIWGLAA